MSLFSTSAFFGAWVAGYCDRLGRRGTLLLGSVVFIDGSICQTAVNAISALYAGRFIAGMGVGILNMIIPLFQSEITHPKIRGSVTSLVQFFLSIGALCSNWIGYGCFSQ